ncbi:tRNA lysidine(34) synthetase TilS [Vibrio sp. FNV 38]|nr:tRNA lysidine(34) synthetase TilS [Vibrio sp. FNV 38]
MTQVESVFEDVMSPLISSGQELVVALSGGLDSVVLLNLAERFARRHQLACRAVHIHHGLSDNADEWALLCENMCQKLDVNYTLERVCLDLTNSESIEKLARDARYRALQASVSGHSILLTGQHGDDQLETFLLALKRGSGPKGLASMGQSSAFYEGRKVRPLLTLSRVDLERWAVGNNLTWIEDESNQDQRFDRNFLRHSVVPPLKQRWPSILDATRRSAALCAEQEGLLDELMGEHLSSSVNSRNGLSLAGIINKSEAYRHRLVRMWLHQQGELMPSQSQMAVLWNSVVLAQPDANPELKLSKGSVRRFQSALYWVEEQQDVSGWRSTLELDVCVTLPDQLGDVCLKSVSEDGKLRAPRQGEHYHVIFDPTGFSAHPESRQHSRKMKKLYQEYGVPSWQRRRIPIIVNNEQVVAVAGLFIDRKFSGKECDLIWTRPSNSLSESY